MSDPTFKAQAQGMAAKLQSASGDRRSTSLLRKGALVVAGASSLAVAFSYVDGSRQHRSASKHVD